MPEKRPKSAKNEHFYQKIRNIWKKLKKTVPFQKKSKKPKTVKIFEKAMRPKKGSAKTQKHETQEATGSERKRHGRRQGSGAEGDRKRTEAAQGRGGGGAGKRARSGGGKRQEATKRPGSARKVKRERETQRARPSRTGTNRRGGREDHTATQRNKPGGKQTRKTNRRFLFGDGVTNPPSLPSPRPGCGPLSQKRPKPGKSVIFLRRPAALAGRWNRFSFYTI